MHMRRRAVHAVLVLTKIVPFAPMRIRKHRVGLYNHLELFLVAALDTKKKKKKTEVTSGICIGIQKKGWAPNLVRMMFERLAAIRLFDVRLVAVARDAEDLVVVLRLAPLERRLGALELAAQRAHVAVRAVELGLLERGAEVRDRVLVLLLVQPDARARAQGFERAWLEDEGRFCVDEGVVVAGELCARAVRFGFERGAHMV